MPQYDCGQPECLECETAFRQPNIHQQIVHSHLGGPKPSPTNAQLAHELECMADEIPAMKADVLLLAAERLKALAKAEAA